MPPLIKLTKVEQAAVDKMVERGVAWLKNAQDANGKWFWDSRKGHTMLAGLTLLECGVPANDPVLAKATGVIRDLCRPEVSRSNTYEIALTLLFLHRLKDPQDKSRIKNLSMRLAAGQYEHGGWSYYCPVLSNEETDRLFALLKEVERQGPPGPKVLPDDLPRNLRGLELLKPDRDIPQHLFRFADNSNTQFAALARRESRPDDQGDAQGEVTASRATGQLFGLAPFRTALAGGNMPGTCLSSTRHENGGNSRNRQGPGGPSAGRIPVRKPHGIDSPSRRRRDSGADQAESVAQALLRNHPD
jgi:hypothetical protein